MTTDPVLTVVTVVRNDVAGLRRTARSVIGQTVQAFEWLIVDGESTDGTWELAGALAHDARVRVLSAPPRGIYDAMNFAAASSSGEWLWYVNAGDFLLGPDAAEFVIDWAWRAPASAALATPVLQVTPRGFVIDVARPRTQRVGDYLVGEYNHQGVVCHKAAWAAIGGFDVALTFGADGKFLDSLAATGSVEIGNVPLAGFVLGGASASNFGASVAQTATFRPMTDSCARRLALRLRNRARLFLLRSECVAGVGVFARKFLAHKQDVRMTDELLHQILTDHWSDHVAIGRALLSCCV